METSSYNQLLHVKAKLGRPSIATASIFVIGCLTFLGTIVSTVPFLILGSGACLIAIVLLLWTNDEPPILMLPALFQWSEVALVPISTIWLKVPLQELSTYGADLNASAIYGLLGVLALAIGMKIGAGRKPIRSVSFSERIKSEAMRWPQAKVFQVSTILIFAGYIFATAMWSVGPLREPFGQAANLKYIGLFILTYWCLLNGRSYGVLALIVCFEIGFGMTGFFANFKNSILTFFVAALFAKPRIRPLDLITVLLAATTIIFVGIFWSAIKPDYREFVNKGSGAQIVEVPLSARIDFLTNAASTLDGEKVADGFQRLVSRHGYIEFLGLVLQNVPQVVSFQNGQITAAVFRHIAIPRLVWPGKPMLPNDTEVMSKYTGLPMTWNSDTSISIGYLGELYADFGYLGGLMGASIIGALVGAVYRTVRNNESGSALVAGGLCLMIVLPIAYFGTAYVKLVGAFVMTAVIVLIMSYFVVPTLFRRPNGVYDKSVNAPKSVRKFSRI